MKLMSKNLLENKNTSNYTTIEEEGPDLIINKKDKGVHIEIQGISNFDALKRLITIITTLMGLYKKIYTGDYLDDHLIDNDFFSKYVIDIYDKKIVEEESSTDAESDLSGFNDFHLEGRRRGRRRRR